MDALSSAQNTLINLHDFQEVAQQLMHPDAPLPELDEVDVDIGTEGLQYGTPFDRVEQAIDAGLEAMVSKRSVNEIREAAQAWGMPSYSTLNVHADLVSLKEPPPPEPWKKENKEMNFLTKIQDAAQNQAVEFEEVALNEMVLSIGIYHPIKNRKSQEFLVIASHPITALRDALYCLSDKAAEGKGDSYLQVENTYIVDAREAGATDVCKALLEGIPLPQRDEFKAQKMEETRWLDLVLRVGGMCQHNLIINEIRMLHKDDSRNRNRYPIMTFQAKFRRHKCKVCDIYPAKYVTYGDALAPETPCFFCDRCYHPFHYAADGKLLYGNFEVYTYIHELY